MMLSTAQATVDPPAAPRAGGDLRAARERLGWSIEMVAAELRIRQPHLDALEAGRIDLLPGNAYAVGFLRTYAALLGLDPDEIVRRFKAEAAEVNRRTELAFPVPLPERGMPAGALILLGVVLAVSAYVGWYRLSSEGKLPAETVIPVPQHLAPLAQQATPLVAAPTAVGKSVPDVPATAPASVASTAPASVVGSATPVTTSSSAAARPSGRSAPSPAAPSPALASVATAPTPAPGALDATPSMPSVSPTSAAAAPIPPSSVAEAGNAAADQIVIQATADAWLEVRDANGNVLLNRTLHAGDTWTVPQQAGLVFTTGNAGGTVLVVDGVASGALGTSGAVRRDLPLDPHLIKEGKLTAAAAGSVQPASLRTNGQ